MRSNPFATRFVAPGRIDWVGESFDTVHGLAHKFLFELSSRAAIVGAHGTGKSTLLEHLLPDVGNVVCNLQPGQRLTDSHLSEIKQQLAAAEDSDDSNLPRIVWLRARRQQDAWQCLRSTRALWQGNSIVVCDGYEQLPPWRRVQLVCETRRRKCGLLVTSHRKTCLPTLHTTLVTVAIAKAVLRQLIPEDLPQGDAFFDERRLGTLLAALDGNLREVLMQFYDDVECRKLVAQVVPAPCIPRMNRPK